MNEYVAGQEIKLTATFRNETGTLTNPATVIFRVFDAVGNETVLSSPTNVTTGIYTQTFTIGYTGGGVWTYRAEGTGLVAAGEEEFKVRGTPFNP